MPDRDDQRKKAAIQEYNLPRMIESELSHMDLPVAISELVDNALDDTPSDQKSEISIIFDARDKRITFKNGNTTGMDTPQLQNFVNWGQEHTNPEMLKEHGQGGKLAILYLLSKDRGSVTVTSRPRNSKDTFQMKLENWWKEQKPGKVFQISSWTDGGTTNSGFTSFEMEGVRDEVIPSSLAELADRIGFVYGPLIAAGKLSIKLNRISKAGRISDSFDILPVTIPIESATMTKAEASVDGGRIKMTILHGTIDISQRDKEARERMGLYNAKKVFQPSGETVNIYYHGKLVDEQKLEKFGITRKKMSLYNFATAVYITEGFVRKTILKTGLSKSDPITARIYNAIRKQIEPYVAKLLGESDPKNIPESDVKKVKEAASKFALILLGLHDNDQNRIRADLNIPTDIHIVSPDQKHSKKTDKKQERAGALKSLPGITDRKLQPKELKVGRATTIFPEIRITPFGQNYPSASLRRDEEQNKLVIALNYNSPDVSLALQTRGSLGLAQILRIAATAMYHEKWLSVCGSDTQTYYDGVQSDVADFLAKAEEMKVI